MFTENEKRILTLMNKIKQGENATVITLGGSITTGYASNPIKEKSWSKLVKNWFLSKTNNLSKINYLNQGVSGTDSAFASARVQNHVNKYNPDLTILEFAMNDQWLESKVRCRTYEGVIRQIMNGSNCAIVALFVNERKFPFAGQQKEQEKICNYYGIPFVSWKDCLQAMNKTSDFEKFFDGEETIHPNNEGHNSIASFVIEKLESYWTKSNTSERYDFSKTISEPIYKNNFENVKYLTNNNLSFSKNLGYEEKSPVHSEWIERGFEKYGWQSCKVDGVISFKLKGKTIGITYCESDEFVNEEAWVSFEDKTESERVQLECYNPIRKGYLGWAYRTILDGTEEKEVVLHIKTLCDKANSKYCNITGILLNN